MSLEHSPRWLEESTIAPDESGDKTKSEVFATIASNIFLFFLIFGLSATVDVKNLRKQLTNKFAIACGVTMQFCFMPILGFISVVMLRNNGLTQAMCISLLVVTSSPGGSYSNWWCSTFNAELALSVAMTTVSSLLSIAMLPANLLLYTYLAYGVTGDDTVSVIEAIDFSSLFTSLAIVLSAIVSGLTAGYIWDNPGFHVAANKLGSASGLLLIIFSLFLSSGGDGAESNFYNQDWSFYVGVAFPCLVGLALANFISRAARLSPPETVAIAIECCYQNTGIGTSVAITMFDDKESRAQAIAVPLFYGLVEAVAIGIYCVLAWKFGWTKAPADENFCTVISKTYEVSTDNEHGNDDIIGDVTEDGGRDNQDNNDAETGRSPDSVGIVGNIRSINVPKDNSTERPSLWARLFFWNQRHNTEINSSSDSEKSDTLDDKQLHTPVKDRKRTNTSDMTEASTISASSTPSPMSPQRLADVTNISVIKEQGNGTDDGENADGETYSV